MDQPFKFHDAYAALTAGLPPSQLRLAQTRLTKCKLSPLTAEEIAGEHPRVQACLEKIAAAYGRKKQRSAIASKARREVAKADVAVSQAVTSSPQQEEPLEPVDDVPSLEACSLEPVPVEVVCVNTVNTAYESVHPTPDSDSEEVTVTTTVTPSRQVVPVVPTPPPAITPVVVVKKSPLAKPLAKTPQSVAQPLQAVDAGKEEAAVIDTIPGVSRISQPSSGRKFFTNQR
jgi:hypothetical protein